MSHSANFTRNHCLEGAMSAQGLPAHILALFTPRCSNVVWDQKKQQLIQLTIARYPQARTYATHSDIWSCDSSKTLMFKVQTFKKHIVLISMSPSLPPPDLLGECSAETPATAFAALRAEAHGEALRLC